mmetsp:Transcript_13080/g.24069  ORF Transcript_13080/g.24069 Transcript_13080/m.24069 type:complete len:92 (+) Transcript_13080:923-1198(+)
MPHDKCRVTLRVLCARGCVQHMSVAMGSEQECFRSHLSMRVPQKVPQKGALSSQDACGSSDLLSVALASSGDYFLGPNKDAVAVQCELQFA